MPFLSFNWTTLVYLLKMLMIHNKNQNLLYFYINCKSAITAPQILSLKDEYALRFSRFAITSLYNSIANCWFDKFSFLIEDLSHIANISEHAHVAAPPEAFHQKIINHWSKFSLISMIFWIFSNIKCSIT